jgi:hypothetical protein
MYAFNKTIRRRKGTLHQKYSISGEFDEFASVIAQVEHMVNTVASEEMATREHGDVEAWIAKESDEYSRRLLQAYLDRRAEREVRRDEVVGCDNVVRNHVRADCTRGLNTLFGDVTVKRFGYSQRGVESLFPLDAELNLPPDSYSLGLRRHAAKGSALHSFDETANDITEKTSGKVPKRQVQELAVKLVQDFNAFYKRRETGGPEATRDLLILTFDGKGVVMRKEGLRKATRQAAEREKHKMVARLSPGEKGNRKRMAEVASVYTVERHERTAAEVIGLLKNQNSAIRPRATSKRVWASLELPMRTVVEDAINEAMRRDPKRKRQWVILVDANKQQLKTIEAVLEQHGLHDVTMILDWVHVLEYLWQAARALHQEGDTTIETWVQERALKILAGKASDVAGGIMRSAFHKGLRGGRRKAVKETRDYLVKHTDMLRYDQYLEQGFPIATGVIEGACRHLVKDRMDITGARWLLERAEAVLKIRALHCSGDFDEYMDFHKVQELSRNHLSRFQQSPLLAAA